MIANVCWNGHGILCVCVCVCVCVPESSEAAVSVVSIIGLHSHNMEHA